MNNLIEQLEKAGAPEAFAAIGLDYDTLFGSAEAFDQNPYRSHQWIVKEHGEFLVVNAIPPAELQDQLFWEEWYLQKADASRNADDPGKAEASRSADGEIHHHILTLWRPQTYHEIFTAPETDAVHPEPSFGQTWYVIEDPDMTPWLLRR